MYIYIKTEQCDGHGLCLPGVWTVGFYDPDGKFQTDSDHNNREDAAKRVHYLNGAK